MVKAVGTNLSMIDNNHIMKGIIGTDVKSSNIVLVIDLVPALETVINIKEALEPNV